MSNDSMQVASYRHTHVATAGRGDLIVILYDEILKQIDIAREALVKGIGHFDRANNAIVKAHDIVTELMVALDMEAGGVVAQNLFNLYSFFCAHLMEANLNKQTASTGTDRPADSRTA